MTCGQVSAFEVAGLKFWPPAPPALSLVKKTTSFPQILSSASFLKYCKMYQCLFFYFISSLRLRFSQIIFFAICQYPALSLLKKLPPFHGVNHPSACEYEYVAQFLSNLYFFFVFFILNECVGCCQYESASAPSYRSTGLPARMGWCLFTPTISDIVVGFIGKQCLFY